LDVNYLGPLAVSRAFRPGPPADGGGALVNVLSVLSWLTIPESGGYSAAQSAMWSATNALRLELAEQKTLVVAVHVGYMDTDNRSAPCIPRYPRLPPRQEQEPLNSTRPEGTATPGRRCPVSIHGQKRRPKP
jgi:NAD(P)-dependent dehydrogenase (short-subunit alcohol dehydrogenase family)